MKLYTRRGDAGETDLLGGGRVPKDHQRVEAYGAVDELNAVLGVCAAASAQDDLRDAVQEIQGQLLGLGAYLASPDASRRERSGVAEPSSADIAALEQRIDALEQELEPLRRFILPGGCPASAAFQLARTVCRRAERRAVLLDRNDTLDPAPLAFLNRLSDLLFVMARVENRRAGVADVEWGGRRS